MGDAGCPHVSENALEIAGFRRGHGIVETAAGVPVFDGPDNADGETGPGQKAFDDVGRGRFTVGAGQSDQDQAGGRVAVEFGRHPGQGHAGVCSDDDRDRNGYRLLRYNGGGAVFHRLVDIVVAVGRQAGDGHKHATRLYLARMIVDRNDIRVITGRQHLRCCVNCSCQSGQFQPVASLSRETIRFRRPLVGAMFK